MNTLIDPIFTYAVNVILLFYFTVFMSTSISNRKDIWNIFTRIGSTINAIQCFYMVLSVIKSYGYDNYYYLFYWGDEYVIKSLYWFSAYLFVDGIFHLVSFYNKPNTQFFTSIIHHFVGGIGIYLMAKERLGFGFGIYFAWTEISTPLLNISWILYTYKIENFLSYVVFGFFIVFLFCLEY